MVNIGDGARAVPDAFVCPITHEVMKEPVSDREGFTYERAAILGWLARFHVSPVTRNPLAETDLAPNRALGDAIAEWRAAAAANQRLATVPVPPIPTAGTAPLVEAAAPAIVSAVFADPTGRCVARNIEAAALAVRAAGIIPASIALFGDPAPGLRKTLTVHVGLPDGAIETRTAVEGDCVDLTDLFPVTDDGLAAVGAVITEANFGDQCSDDRTVATARAAAAVLGAVPADPHLFGWAARVPRDLRLTVLRCDGTFERREAAEGHVLLVGTPHTAAAQRAREHVRAAAAGPASPLLGRDPIVLHAEYGDRRNPAARRVVIDVAAARRAADATGVVPAANGLFGDPAYGVVKTLAVIVRLPDGGVATRTACEGGAVDLRDLYWARALRAFAGRFGIVRALYGDFATARVVDGTAAAAGAFAELGSVAASNTLFGDPAFGTRKELRLRVRQPNGVVLELRAPEGDAVDVRGAMLEALAECAAEAAAADAAEAVATEEPSTSAAPADEQPDHRDVVDCDDVACASLSSCDVASVMSESDVICW